MFYNCLIYFNQLKIMIYSDIIKYTFIHYIIQYKKIIILSHFLIKKKSITLNKYQKK